MGLLGFKSQAMAACSYSCSSPSLVSLRPSESGLARAIVCRASFPSTYTLHHTSAGRPLSLETAPLSARFISVLSVVSRRSVKRHAILALDPDFYKIPYVEGIPVGKKLKLWNLPPNCKHSELLEWFTGINVTVESLEFTDDPELNSQGIGGFVEFGTKQEACMAIVRLDGYKFRGHCIRMDFVEKRPHERDYGSRRNRPSYSSRNNSSRSVSDFQPRRSYGTQSRPSVTDSRPSYGGMNTGSSQTAPRYGDANAGSIQTPPAYGNGTQSDPGYGSTQNTPSYGITQSSPDYGIAPSAPGPGSSPGSTPSAPSFGSTQSAPSYGTTPGYSSSQPGTQSVPRYGSRNSSYDSAQPAPSYSGTQSTPSYGNTNRQSAPVYSSSTPLAPSYSNSSTPSSPSNDNSSLMAPSYSNSNTQPVHSYGAQPAESYRNSSTQVPPNFDNNSPQAAPSYGPNIPEALSSSQSGSSYGNSSTQPAPSFGSSSTQSGPIYGNTSTQSVPSYGNNGTQSTSSFNNSIQSSPSYGSTKSSPGHGSIPPAPNYGSTQTASGYSSMQTGPSYGGTQTTPFQAAPSYGSNTPSFSSGIIESPPSSSSPSYSKMDPVSSYRSPSNARVEPRSSNISSRLGPMYGSPQPSSLNRLFVGNLALSIDDASLQQLFSKYGTVLEARVLRDQEGGRSRGFGVVAMSSVDEMKAASEALDGWQVESRRLKVNAAASRFQLSC